MKEMLKELLKEASSIEEVLQIVLDTVGKMKMENPQVRIGYVSGKVTADGKENIAKNLERLHSFTEIASKEFGDNIFSAADVFNEEVYWKINLPRPIHEEEFYDFWQKI